MDRLISFGMLLLWLKKSKTQNRGTSRRLWREKKVNIDYKLRMKKWSPWIKKIRLENL